MIQSVTERLREYIGRSNHREGTDEMLDRAVRWFTEQQGDMAADAIDFGQIDDYRSWLIKGRSAGSANTYLSLMKAFFGWMAKRRFIEADPFDGVSLYPVTQAVPEQYALDEISRIFRVANPTWRAMVALALCSMREAEILNLVVSDVDFGEQVILINPKRRTAATWRWDIKDYQRAYIGIDETIVSMLAELVEALPNGQPYVVLKERYWRRNLELQALSKLSHRKRNCPWGNFNRDYRALLRRARVKPKRFHDLRGTFATERYNDGYDLKELQYLMRHSNVQTTARYIRTVEARKLVMKSGQTFAKHYATKVS